MKYRDLGKFIVLSIMVKRAVSEIQEKLTKIYLDEKDEKKQNKLLGKIDTIYECQTLTTEKLYKKLVDYKTTLQSIKECPDMDFFYEKSYYEGCCDGVRKIIKLHKDFSKLCKKIFFIFFTATPDIEFEIHSAFILNEKNINIFEYKDSVEPEKNYFSVTSDVNDVVNILQQKDEEHEYVVVISYDAENIHSINDMKLISDLCNGNYYFLKSIKNKGIIETGAYIEKIIKTIK